MGERGWLLDATFGRLWDAIVVALRGKHVAVLGARGVGKSHFIKFLTTGSIPLEYKQTVAPEKTSGRRLQLQELDLKIKAMLDVGGGIEARAQWHKQVNGADVVFYLFRVDHVNENNQAAVERILSDGRHLGEWLRDRKERPKLCIVGTHCDYDSSFQGQHDNFHGDYVTKLRNQPTVRKLTMLCGGMSQVSLVVGSMKTVQSTEDLVSDVFKHIGNIE